MNIKYNNEAVVVISLPITRNYTVWAMANKPKESNEYNVQLYLKENTIGMLNEIETGNFSLTSDPKSIRKDIASYVTDLRNNNFFVDYIDRCEYEFRCFDRGNEYYEELKHVVE